MTLVGGESTVMIKSADDFSGRGSTVLVKFCECIALINRRVGFFDLVSSCCSNQLKGLPCTIDH